MKTEGWNLTVSPPQTKLPVFQRVSGVLIRISYGKLILILPLVRETVTLLPVFVWQAMIHVRPIFCIGG